MTHAQEIPTTEQVQKTLANSRRRRELEIVSLQLQDLILQLELSNLHKKRQERKLK
jgi:hypothetical protein